jgi:hypothetical protein
MCEIYIGDYEAWKCFRTETRTARKEHKCACCGLFIPKGARYVYASGIDADRHPFWEYACLRCEAAAKGVKAVVEAPRTPPAELGGTKHDNGKSRLDLLSSVWIFGVGEVLRYGAAKYAEQNWRKGIAYSRLAGAALRHVFAWLGGENDDPETGLSHLLHASCSLMFLYETSQTRPDLDDRWKNEPARP